MSIISRISVGGIAVATMAIVVVLSVFNGFDNLARKRLGMLDPQLSVQPASGPVLADADSLASILALEPDVAMAVPTLGDRALIISGDVQIPVVFKGVGSGYGNLTSVDSLMIDGVYAPADLNGTPAMQVSVGVANTLFSQPLNSEGLVSLYVPRRTGRINPANPSAAFREATVAVSGIYRADNPDIDNETVIIPLATARDLLLYETQAGAVELKLAPGSDIMDVKQRLARQLGDKYKVLDRLEQRSDTLHMIAVEKWVTLLMLLCIMLIALFNIISTLSLLVLEKKRDMATLYSLGARRSMIKNIFACEGFIITLYGGALGIIMGTALSLAQQWGGFIKLSADPSALSIETYPVSVSATDLLLTAAIIIVTGALTSLITRFFVKPTTKF